MSRYIIFGRCEIDIVRVFFDCGLDANDLGFNDWPLAFIVCSYGHHSILTELFVPRGLDIISYRDADGSTLMHAAFQNAIYISVVSVVHFLRLYGISLNDRDNRGSTPLDRMATFPVRELHGGIFGQKPRPWYITANLRYMLFHDAEYSRKKVHHILVDITSVTAYKRAMVATVECQRSASMTTFVDRVTYDLLATIFSYLFHFPVTPRDVHVCTRQQ
jgi:ankyrin repeat protein